jgi:hypothetical protein
VPVEVKGIRQLRTNLRLLDKKLLKEFNTELKAAMMPVRDAARGFVPDGEPPGLSRWARPPRKAPVDRGYRPFPKFDAQVIRKGIVYRSGKNKANNNGFSSYFYVANLSAAGGIYETAGRKNPSGQPWKGPKHPRDDRNVSHSSNPEAGAHFIQYMPPMYGKGKERGRLIFKAWEQDQGKATVGVMRAIENATQAFNKRSADLDAIWQV